MSLREILRESGVRHEYRFNRLSSNWYVQLRKLEARGFEVVPVRIGSRRVVLALNNSRSRPRLAVPILAVVVVLVAVISSLNLRATKHEIPFEAESSCVAVPEVNTYLNSSDWKFDTESIQQTGNLELLSVVASCGAKFWRGSVLVAHQRDGDLIKKLAPTKSSEGQFLRN